MILQGNQLLPTPDELLSAEEQSLQQVNGTKMIWSGRAATGLGWAYRIASMAGGSIDMPEIIVPAISCVTPAAVALTAGCRVRFADVDPETGLISLDTVRRCWSPATRAVVFIHLYGQTADLEPLGCWCRDHGVLLIEDVAQAQGARYPDSKPVGSVGDIAVYSFNRTKILECGGGALILRSERTAALWSEVAADPSPEISDDIAGVLALSQRDLYQSLVALRRISAVPCVSTQFSALHEAYAPLFRRSMPSAAAVAGEWEKIPMFLEARAKKAARYSARLAGGPWKLMDGWRSSGVCWRYTLLVDSPEAVVEFTEAVRRDGFYVSNLYWPVCDLLPSPDACPAAEAFSRRLMNLWVNASVDIDWVDRCCDSLLTHAERSHGW